MKLYHGSTVRIDEILLSKSKPNKMMVEHIVSDMISMLIEKEGYEFSKAFETVYASDTYNALLKPQSNLYYQSSGYVFSYLLSEIRTGKMN